MVTVVGGGGSVPEDLVVMLSADSMEIEAGGMTTFTAMVNRARHG